jgi:hypothetical protein
MLQQTCNQRLSPLWSVSTTITLEYFPHSTTIDLDWKYHALCDYIEEKEANGEAWFYVRIETD